MRPVTKSILAAAAAALLPLAALAAETGAGKAETRPAKGAEAKGEAKPEKGDAAAAKAPAGKGASDAAASPVVLMKTTMGDIKVRLDREKAPKTVENFLKYVEAKFYDGTIFHRVIPDFMVQGGGFTADMQQKPTSPPIPIESQNGLSNRRGTLAMARTADPNSATAQFFINVVDNMRLDYRGGAGGEGYAVFGEVIEGMDVVDKIKAVKTTTKPPHANVPESTVTIESVRLVP